MAAGRTRIVALAALTLAAAGSLAACGKRGVLERPAPLWGKERIEGQAPETAAPAEEDGAPAEENGAAVRPPAPDEGEG